MKTIFKKIIYFILTMESRLVLLRYKPKIVAVTGTVGKTGTKDAIYHAMSSVFHVRKNNKSLNSEIGVPLTILGLESGWNNPAHWLKNIIIGGAQIFYKHNYPKWLVLETGIDQPGDMKRTASWLKPHIAVVTAFAKVPSHVENFDSPEEVMEEEGSLMNFLREDGVLILNCDDEDVLRLKSKSENKVHTYGFEGGDITASNYSIVYSDDRRPSGISFKVNYEGNIIPVTISGVIGDQFIYPILAALSVGVVTDASVVDMATALSQTKFAPGRMNLLEGEGGSLIIDDTYNSSPIAAKKAIEALTQVETRGLRVAVLGDMLEIGHFSANEHKKIGSLVAENKIDALITVGVRSESTSQQAIENGMNPKAVFHFKDSEEAIQTVKDFSREGNTILVKGSQGIRMEKISREILKDKERSADLLVRQEEVWKDK